jgi:DNA-binding winged helix-turn-helix (wHTH) protein
VYQAGPPLDIDDSGPVQVVLIFDVPAGFIELPSRTAQLADEYGRLIASSIPGVRARPAMITATDEAPRSTGTSPPKRFEGLLIDRAGRDVRVGGLPVRLSYREFELLCFLAEHPRQPVSRARLIREVWELPAGARDTESSGRTVDTHVRRLRVKLGSHARVITTIRGRGYRFDAGTDVRYVPAGADRYRA